MADVVINVRDNGPLLVKGPAELTDAEGKQYKVENQFYLCRCGLSGKKPFCDGSHKGKFESQPRA